MTELKRIRVEMSFEIPASAQDFRNKVTEIIEKAGDEIEKLRVDAFLKQGSSKTSVEEIQEEVLSKEDIRSPLSMLGLDSTVNRLSRRLSKLEELWTRAIYDEIVSLHTRVANLEAKHKE